MFHQLCWYKHNQQVGAKWFMRAVVQIRIVYFDTKAWIIIYMTMISIMVTHCALQTNRRKKYSSEVPLLVWGVGPFLETKLASRWGHNLQDLWNPCMIKDKLMLNGMRCGTKYFCHIIQCCCVLRLTYYSPEYQGRCAGLDGRASACFTSVRAWVPSWVVIASVNVLSEGFTGWRVIFDSRDCTNRDENHHGIS